MNRKAIKSILTALMSVALFITSSMPAYAAGTYDSGDGIFQITGSVTQKQLDIARSAYNKYPKQVRQFFVSKGIKIYLFNGKEASLGKGENGLKARALADAPVVTIHRDNYGNPISAEETQGNYCITANAKLNAESGGGDMAHEIGHIVDFTYNGGITKTYEWFNASHTDEFYSLYNKEHKALGTITKTGKYNVYSAEEAFAEATGCYIMYPAELRKKCPGMYSYVEHILITYNGGGSAPVLADDVPQIIKADDPVIVEGLARLKAEAR